MNKIILAFTISIFLTGCIFKQDYYMLMYYPNGELTNPTFKKGLESREACLQLAYSYKNQRNNFNDDFECGKNCKESEHTKDFYICEETFDG